MPTYLDYLSLGVKIARAKKRFYQCLQIIKLATMSAQTNIRPYQHYGQRD